MKKVYADKQLNYNEGAIFDLDEGYNPCEFIGGDNYDDMNDIEEVYE
jgi:hypothetical protein